MPRGQLECIFRRLQGPRWSRSAAQDTVFVPRFRAINSAGECLPYKEEVGGSNPSSPTTARLGQDVCDEGTSVPVQPPRRSSPSAGAPRTRASTWPLRALRAHGDRSQAADRSAKELLSATSDARNRSPPSSQHVKRAPKNRSMDNRRIKLINAPLQIKLTLDLRGHGSPLAAASSRAVHPAAWPSVARDLPNDGPVLWSQDEQHSARCLPHQHGRLPARHLHHRESSMTFRIAGPLHRFKLHLASVAAGARNPRSGRPAQGRRAPAIFAICSTAALDRIERRECGASTGARQWKSDSRERIRNRRLRQQPRDPTSFVHVPAIQDRRHSLGCGCGLCID